MDGKERERPVLVEPDFPDHWKTRMLVGLLGNDELAPLYVIRLWAHCQDRRQWIFPAMPDQALCGICKWGGETARFIDAMVTTGYLSREGGGFRALKWEVVNAGMVASWENGKRGGRPKAPEITHGLSEVPVTETHGPPNKRREDKTQHETNEEDSCASNDADGIEPELVAWMDWWNQLHASRLVSAGVDVNPPSAGVKAGWKRVKRDRALQSVLQDRDAIEREIRASKFVREGGWFTLPKLLGGKNREGEIVVTKLVQGGYRDDKRGNPIGPGQHYDASKPVEW